MSACESTYTAWAGLVLRCNGQHLRGNPFRSGGLVHGAKAHKDGVTWTWYDDEADRPDGTS